MATNEFGDVAVEESPAGWGDAPVPESPIDWGDVSADPLEVKKAGLRAEKQGIAFGPSEFMANASLGLLNFPKQVLGDIDSLFGTRTPPEEFADTPIADDPAFIGRSPESLAKLQAFKDRFALLESVRETASPVSTGLSKSAVHGVEAMASPSGVAILGASIAVPQVMGPVIATLGIEGVKDALGRMKEARETGDRPAYWHGAGDFAQVAPMLFGGAKMITHPMFRESNLQRAENKRFDRASTEVAKDSALELTDPRYSRESDVSFEPMPVEKPTTVQPAESVIETLWSSSEPIEGQPMYLSNRKTDAESYALGRPVNQYEVSVRNPFDPSTSKDTELVALFEKHGGIHEAPTNPEVIAALKAKGYDSVIGGEKGYGGESRWVIPLDGKTVKLLKPSEQAALSGKELNQAFKERLAGMDPQALTDAFGEWGFEVGENGRVFSVDRGTGNPSYLSGKALADAKNEFLRLTEPGAVPAPKPASPGLHPDTELNLYGAESIASERGFTVKEVEGQWQFSKEGTRETVTLPSGSTVGQVQSALSGNTQMIGMGAAVQGELSIPSPQTATSIKNTRVDQERQTRGLPSAIQPARRAFGTVWDEAMALVDRDPGSVDRLVDDLRAKPRALTDLEDAMLLHRQIDLQNEFGKATRDLARAYEDGQVEVAAAEQARVNILSDQLLDLYNIGKKVGTETGRGLNARKMMAYEDFTLAQMTMTKRAANEGRPLTNGESAEIQRLHDIIDATQKAHDAYVADAQSKLVEAEIKRVFAESKTKYHPSVLDHAEKIVVGFEKRAAAASVRLKEKLARTNMAADPSIILDLAEIGVAKLGRGILDLAKFSESIIAEFGPKVQPFLAEAFETAKKMMERDLGAIKGPNAEKVKKVVKKEGSAGQIEATKEAIKTKIDSGERGDITGSVQKLARMFVEQGIATRDALVDAVHAVLVEFDPAITKRETADAISGYGNFKQLSKDEISVKLRDLKGQLQQVAKLEDILSRQPPLKSGVERRTPTDEERRLIKQVNEAKRKYGIVVTDPATQLKSALAARKTYYRNQISDLESQINSREKIVKEKSPSPTDAELEALKAKRNALKEEFDEIFEKPGLTEEQRAQKAFEVEKKSLEKRIAEQERILRERDLAPKGAQKNRPAIPGIEELKQQRDQLNKEISEARKKPETQKAAEAMARKLEALNKRIAAVEAKIAAGDLSTKPSQVNRPLSPELEQAKQRLEAVNAQMADLRKGPSKSQDEISLQSLKTRLKNETEKFNKRLKEGDFAKRERKPITMDAEALRLRQKNEEAKTKFLEGVFKDKLARRSRGQKLLSGAGQILGLSRVLKTTYDVSAVLRQGKYMVLSRPVTSLKSVPDMFRALMSKDAQFRIEQEIKHRANYPLYQRSGLFLSEHGTVLSRMEENYMSRWSEKIPGVAASQRAYTTFLNKLRADSFDVLSKTLSRTGEMTPAEAKAIANYINVATGRGGPEGFAKAAVGLNTIFFAPRYVASRFQMLLGQPLYGGTARTRKLIATEYARILAGAAVVYMLYGAAGGELETDPRSSDFGKMRFGETRIDPLAGLVQITTLMSRLATGETTTLRGKTVPIRGDTPYGGSDAVDVTARFLRSKLAPIPSVALNTLAGKDIIGQPVTVGSTINSLVVPISWDDIRKTMEEQGIPKGTVMSILSLFGEGVQTYTDEK